MAEKDWRSELKELFEGIEIIELSQRETFTRFNKFREMVAEPAFELLAEELKQYRVKAFFTKAKGRTIHFWMSFPRSRKDCFHYIIYLPKNSVDLNLKLRLRARRTPKTPFAEHEKEFMDGLSPAEVMKMTKEELILDIITHCRNLKYVLHTRPD